MKDLDKTFSGDFLCQSLVNLSTVLTTHRALRKYSCNSAWHMYVCVALVVTPIRIQPHKPQIIKIKKIQPNFKDITIPHHLFMCKKEHKQKQKNSGAAYSPEPPVGPVGLLQKWLWCDSCYANLITQICVQMPRRWLLEALEREFITITHTHSF